MNKLLPNEEDLSLVLKAAKVTNDPAIRSVFETLKSLVSDHLSCQNPAKTYSIVDAYLSFVWEKLNTGHWSLVEIGWRELFTVISVIKIKCVLQVMKSDDLDVLKDVVKICDVGLMMGAPILNNVCGKIAAEIGRNFGRKRQLNELDLGPAKRLKPHDLKPLKNLQILEAKSPPSIEDFLVNFKNRNEPVLIRGLIEDWPAIKQWSVDYFSRVAGLENRAGGTRVPLHGRGLDPDADDDRRFYRQLRGSSSPEDQGVFGPA